MRTASLPFAAAAVMACGAHHGPGDAGPLAPPAVGIQLASTSVTLAPGTEQYTCWAVQLPQGAPFPIVGIEQQIPLIGVHHYSIFTSSDAYQGPAPFDCSVMGVTWGLVTGGGIGTPGVAFPNGTAMTLNGQNPPPQGQAPWQQVLLQLHLLNASQAPLTVPPAYVNLDSTTSTSGLQQVGLLIGGSVSIDIPPQTTGFQVEGNCTLRRALQNIFAVFPHMHTLGKHISVTTTPAGSSTPQVLVDRDWTFSEQGLDSVTGQAAVGDSITTTCTYDNPGTQSVSFGLSTKDEMCFGVLYYWPADPSKLTTVCGL